MKNIKFSGCGTGIGNHHIKDGGILATYVKIINDIYIYIFIINTFF